jgi:NAD(P)-dependent dehydrogenase (short-subunit alcohol dehydrogenase family)
MRRLKGRTAVVTGAASGIGRSLIDRLASEDMNLVLADIDGDHLGDVVDQVRRRGNRAIGVRTDVGAPASLDELAEAAFEEFGLPHLVCANAGVNRFARFQELSLDDWQWIIGVNLMGVVHTVRSFLPLLLQGRNGCVAITASMASFMGGVDRSAYTAAKHAVLAVADTVADELAADGRTDIGVTTMFPGPVRTEIAFAGRHRPGRIEELTEDDRRFADFLASSGVEPAAAADQLVESVMAGKRYVFTHPDLARQAIERRYAAMLADLDAPV